MLTKIMKTGRNTKQEAVKCWFIFYSGMQSGFRTDSANDFNVRTDREELNEFPYKLVQICRHTVLTALLQLLI